ncbi:unnamed protein product, partial [Didymodactylos carnosus]
IKSLNHINMVTSNLNDRRQQSLSPIINDKGEDNDVRILHRFLDRLYLGAGNDHPQRVSSPISSSIITDMTTIPVYRNGRKFYVTAEEYERMKAHERKQRRTALQKSNNLPVQKSYSSNHTRSRVGGGVDHHHPIIGVQRATSHAINGTMDQTFGFSTNNHNSATILTPITMRKTVASSTQLTSPHLTRQSRSTSRSDEQRSYSPANVRSHSSDKISVNRAHISSPLRTSFDDDPKTIVTRTFSPVPVIHTHNRSNTSDSHRMTLNNNTNNNRLVNYIPHDFNQHSHNFDNNQYQENIDPQRNDSLKRSMSAELVIPSTNQYGISSINTLSMTPLDKQSIITDQVFIPTNSKLSNKNQTPKSFVGSSFDTESKFDQKQPVVSKSSNIGSMYQTGVREADHLYSMLGPLRRSNDATSPDRNFNTNNRDITGLLNDRFISYSDDNSSIIKRDDDNNIQKTFLSNGDGRHLSRERRTQPRSTVRSHSSDGLTKKKRVRFADMVGLNLETVDRVSRRSSGASSDGEQQSYQANFKQQQQLQQHYTRLLSRRPPVVVNDRTKVLQFQRPTITNDNFQTYKISKNNAGSLVTDV